MPNLRKVNSNGPPPGCPNSDDPYEKSLERAMHESLEDAEYAEGERNRRAGVGVHTSKAPWLVNPGK